MFSDLNIEYIVYSCVLYYGVPEKIQHVRVNKFQSVAVVVHLKNIFRAYTQVIHKAEKIKKIPEIMRSQFHILQCLHSYRSSADVIRSVKFARVTHSNIATAECTRKSDGKTSLKKE